MLNIVAIQGRLVVDDRHGDRHEGPATVLRHLADVYLAGLQHFQGSRIEDEPELFEIVQTLSHKFVRNNVSVSGSLVGVGNHAIFVHEVNGKTCIVDEAGKGWHLEILLFETQAVHEVLVVFERFALQVHLPSRAFLTVTSDTLLMPATLCL